MTTTGKWIKRCIQGITYAVSFAMSYAALAFCAFLLAAVSLNRGVVFSNEIMKGYQRTYYIGGMRNILPTETCIDFDSDLLYRPRIGACVFENPEFETILHFDEDGRVSHGKTNRPGIAAVGDSFTMGWGVNDDETFSALIERMTGRPVYNLGVSSYATHRELLRLQKSGLLPKVDTVILQYCGNDLAENQAHETKAPSELRGQYTSQQLLGLLELISHRGSPPVWKLWMMSAIEIPILWARAKVTNSRREFYESYELYPYYHYFAVHHSALIKILENFPELAEKKVVVFYVNSRGSKFYDFLRVADQRPLHNVSFAELDLEPDLFYTVDDHLTARGHQVVAQRLLPYVVGTRKSEQQGSP